MHTTRFWLNDRLVETDAHPGLLVLDYVRQNRLTGTKEGCKEGDCGACTILVGSLVDGKLRYEPVTSCLVPLGEMQGKHVVTVEGINFGDRLSFVQDAMVHNGGTQCGYCTPGFIVSMTWYLLADDEPKPSMEGFKRAISGNLCRCTGYASINRAGQQIVDALSQDGEYEAVWLADDRVATAVERGLLPKYFAEMQTRLAELDEPRPNGADAEFFVAGGTDLYVQRGEEIPKGNVAILNHHPEMRGIRFDGQKFRVGALTTFTQFAEDEEIRKLIPRMDDFIWLIASLHIRNRATLGGNIVNASPIGDMTALLLALDSTLVLKEVSRSRQVPMRDFFLGYKTLDKRPRELVTEVIFDAGNANTHINFEKISKRKALDIATVCSGARIVARDGVIESAHVSMGGVAPIPLLLSQTCGFLRGKPINAATVRDAFPIAQSEISPISDVRGSAEYKRLLVNQILIAHFAELFPQHLDYKDIATVGQGVSA